VQLGSRFNLTDQPYWRRPSRPRPTQTRTIPKARQRRRLPARPREFKPVRTLVRANQPMVFRLKPPGWGLDLPSSPLILANNSRGSAGRRRSRMASAVGPEFRFELGDQVISPPKRHESIWILKSRLQMIRDSKQGGGKPLTEDPDRKAHDQAPKEIKPSGHSDKGGDCEAGRYSQLLSTSRRASACRGWWSAHRGALRNSIDIQLIPLRQPHAGMVT
jgi:hypothetical protein